MKQTKEAQLKTNFNARKDGIYEKIWQATNKCVFCDLKDKYIITEKDDIVLTVNLFPYLDGHLMVIPRRHFEKFEEVTPEEWSKMLELSKLGISLLRENLEVDDVWVLFRAPNGFRGGKSVSHAHLHLIPYANNVTWEYKEISVPPVELAERLRGGLVGH